MSDSTTARVTANAISWFEIPVANFERAQRFYEAIFETPLRGGEFMGQRIAVFPYEGSGVGGCIAEDSHPSPHGTLVYLNADGRLDRTLDRVAGAGGRIDEPKTELPGEMGFSAHIIDSEGNRVGLHAMI